MPSHSTSLKSKPLNSGFDYSHSQKASHTIGENRNEEVPVLRSPVERMHHSKRSERVKPAFSNLNAPQGQTSPPSRRDGAALRKDPSQSSRAPFYDNNNRIVDPTSTSLSSKERARLQEGIRQHSNENIRKTAEQFDRKMAEMAEMIDEKVAKYEDIDRKVADVEEYNQIFIKSNK